MGLLTAAPVARADIYDNNGNLLYSTSQTGIDAVPFADLSFLDLTNANLRDRNLYFANLNNSTLSSADFTGANLINSNLSAATFDDATFSGTALTIFTNAQIASANFNFGTSQGFTQAMLAGDPVTHVGATKSYLVKDLIGVNIGSNDMSGWNLSQQNLAVANLSLGTYAIAFDAGLGTDFTQTNLASAFGAVSDFSNRNLGLPTFGGAVFTGSNLGSINLSSSTLNGADFTHANLSFAALTGASFGTTGIASGSVTIIVPGGTISNAADFTDASISFANLSSTVGATTSSDKGFRFEILQQTASYQNHDLRGINLSSNDLTVGGNVTVSGGTIFTAGGTTWNFSGQNLTGANFSNSTLAINVASLVTQSTATFITRRTANVNALFTGANLSSVNFSGAALAGTINGGGNLADFTGATVNFANFSSTTSKGFRKEQLEQTASWQNKNLRGINFSSDNLTASGTTNIGWNFGSQDLSFANFSNATLSSTIGTTTYRADFSNATVAFANFSSTTSRGLTSTMLFATASAGSHDLRGINLSSNNLITTVNATTAFGWDFSNQNLASANFSSATLGTVIGVNIYSANFSGATVASANFSSTTSKGFTYQQLHDTASFGSFDLRGINLSSNTLVPGTGTQAWNFSNQNLTGASFTSSSASTLNFSGATLTLASLNNVTLSGASFGGATMTSANLSGSTLTTADFTGATLTSANFSNARLFSANFSNADLTGANLSGATFSSGSSSIDGATFSHATIKGANLSFATLRGFTQNMLYDTDSYQNPPGIEDLTGLNLSNNDLSGWVFGDGTMHTNMNLSSVSFANSTLSGAGGVAQFTNTTIAFANFSQTTGAHGLTQSMLGDSKSWVNNDLRGVNFSFDDLTTWDFTNQNLATANFSNASLSTGGTTDFTVFAGANIQGANFSTTTSHGFTKAQLYETQSYIDGDLRYVNLSFNNLAPVDNNGIPLAAWDLDGQNLQGATFDSSILSNYDVSSGTPVLAHSVDFTGANIKDASFNSTTDKGFTFAQLASTQSYADHNLGAIGLGSDNLSSWDLSGQNLNKANFAIATLDSTNFTGAKIAGANFSHTTPFGFTQAQLESTFSWPNLTLGSINLSENNMAGWNFASQSMAKANFTRSLLTGTNFNDALLHDATFTNAGLMQTSFDRADLRGAVGFTGAQLSTNNTILPDGTIQGLDLTSTYPLSQRHLTIRDYNGAASIPVHITQQFALDSTSTLQIRLHDGSWGSTVSFDPGISVTLAGTLDLGLDDQALHDPTLLASLYDYPGHARPIQLFNWNTQPSSQFDTIVEDPRFSWDTSHLYDLGVINVEGLYGDVNRDGRVDIADLYIIAQHYQQSTPLWANGDMNGDGVVNVADLKLLAENWGFGVYDDSPTGSNPPPSASLGPVLVSLGLPVVAVPEPVMGCPLVMLAALTFLRRSRR